MKQLTDFLFRCNPEPAWIFDRETLRFLAVNEAAVQRYGYSEDEFLGMTIADIRPPEDVPRLLALHQDARPSPQDAGRWRHTLKDGRILTVEVRAFRRAHAAVVQLHVALKQPKRCPGQSEDAQHGRLEIPFTGRDH